MKADILAGVVRRTASAIREKFCRRLWVSVAATATASMVAAVMSLCIGVTPASAGATGCSFWNPITVGGRTLSTGEYCVTVSGSGNYVGAVAGGFVSAVPVCNWNITAEFFNSSSQWLWTLNGGVHYSCTVAYNTALSIYSYQTTGFVCSTLKQNGAKIISRCYAIHP